MFMRFVESGEGVWLAGFLMASRLTIASLIGNIDGPCIMLEFIKYVTRGPWPPLTLYRLCNTIYSMTITQVRFWIFS